MASPNRSLSNACNIKLTSPGFAAVSGFAEMSYAAVRIHAGASRIWYGKMCHAFTMSSSTVTLCKSTAPPGNDRLGIMREPGATGLIDATSNLGAGAFPCPGELPCAIAMPVSVTKTATVLTGIEFPPRAASFQSCALQSMSTGPEPMTSARRYQEPTDRCRRLRSN